jgi:hypothetical protein
MKILNSQNETIPLAKVADLPVETAPAVAVPPRPSLEVEMEVHQNMKPRIHAHVGRMRAWDLRKLPLEVRNEFTCALDAFGAGQERLEIAMAKLFTDGFVAKTTPATRIAAKLEPGARVTLRADQRATFAAIYTDEQLDSLSVVRTTDTHVLLQADDSSSIGLVKIIHVEIKS